MENVKGQNLVKASGENAILNGPEGDIHDVVEEVCAACTALERLGHDVLVIREVSTAIAARVYSCSRQKGTMHTPHFRCFQLTTLHTAKSRFQPKIRKERLGRHQSRSQIRQINAPGLERTEILALLLSSLLPTL